MEVSKKHRIFKNINSVDISENDIRDYSPHILEELLVDHTLTDIARQECYDKIRAAKNYEDRLTKDELKSVQNTKVNITWATHDYESLWDKDGACDDNPFRYEAHITPECITGDNGRVIMPRVMKDAALQTARSKNKAEVFTPSWICNAQNNLIDREWFGYDAFNTESIDSEGHHIWEPTSKVKFPEDDPEKTWKSYVEDNRLEITCGEAPYLVSRYDTTTGEYIPLEKRIGLLDRKLRVINENVDTSVDDKEWVKWVKKAYQHTYGYEWQGDNLLLAREALFYTFIENYMAVFNGKKPQWYTMKAIARIISWNLWQMDGLKMVVPDSCKVEMIERRIAPTLFNEVEQIQYEARECQACKKGEMTGHNGIHCLIRNWDEKRPKNYVKRLWEDPKSASWQKIKFSSLYEGTKHEKTK